MFPLKLETDIGELTSYGSVGNLGATVIAGSPEASGKAIFGAPGDPIFVGLFGCTSGKFLVTYPYNEHGTVLRGTATLTDEASGQSVSYGPGDSWFVEAGKIVLWEIISPTFVKQYLAIPPTK